MVSEPLARGRLFFSFVRLHDSASFFVLALFVKAPYETLAIRNANRIHVYGKRNIIACSLENTMVRNKKCSRHFVKGLQFACWYVQNVLILIDVLDI